MHSNFITPPDFIKTILVLNATEEQITACGEACKAQDIPYNVYFYNDAMNDTAWLDAVKIRADVTLDAKINQPQEFFNK